MSFNDIPKIETKDWYLDLAFRRAKKVSGLQKTQTRGGRIEKVRAGELARVKEIKRVLTKHLMGILKSFPSMDDLTEFYNELVRATLDYAELKKSLGALNWAKQKIEDLSGVYHFKLRKCQHLRKISDYSNEYYGRISSVMHQIKKRLEYLDKARMVMRDFPSIKSDMYTVCIAGFPNVGKTTLLSQLTPSTPEIANYAFTTKKLNVGYGNIGHKKVQFIDTPGTLNRDDEMNSVEMQAYLAMKYCGELIVFVMDPTETYPLKQQKKLYDLVKKLSDANIFYVSKTDIARDDQIEEIKKAFKKPDDFFLNDIESLKNKIKLLIP